MDFLHGRQVQALLWTHPNDCHRNLEVVPDVDWPLLVQFYVSGQSDQPIPQDLAEIINQIKHHELTRKPMPIPNTLKLPTELGMSPKKSHEVSRMATYIVRLIHANNLLEDDLRIVDIGAGQGYLTRSLKYHLRRVHILALDVDEQQTNSAQKWERRLLPDSHPPIAHKTLLVTPQSLLSVVDEWIQGTQPKNQPDKPIPVLFVALHACGSLTLDILRAYINSRERKNWSGAGVVAVGCCYNLMYPGDFPLSYACASSGNQPLHLPNSAFHLAAQVPSVWLQSVSPPMPKRSVSLATKKILFRASLSPLLEKASPAKPSACKPIGDQPRSAPLWSRRPEFWERRSSYEGSATEAISPLAEFSDESKLLAPGIGYASRLVRLGKLHDRFYESWSSFLKAAEEKLALRFPADVFNEETRGSANEVAKVIFERKVQALHTMRCLLGPVVESTILKDRVQWVKDTLGSKTELQVQLVNLFDQSTGSGRNVAIVMASQLPV